MLWLVWVNHVINSLDVESRTYLVVATSKVDAMHIAELLYGGCARDAIEYTN